MHYNTMGNDASSQSYPFQQHFNEEAVDSGEGCELAWQRSGCRSVSGSNLSSICAGTKRPYLSNFICFPNRRHRAKGWRDLSREQDWRRRSRDEECEGREAAPLDGTAQTARFLFVNIDVPG